MRVLICGDRHYADVDKVDAYIARLPQDAVVIHGGAKGADSIAGQCASNRKLEVLEFPADWQRYGRGAGPIRNKQMLAMGQPDMVVYFHPNLSASKGTKHMIRIAREHGVPAIDGVTAIEA